jgi:hypothetical protein
MAAVPRGEPVGPWPKQSGDVYVLTPDESEIALAWESRGPPIRELMGPSQSRWGVLQVLFPIPVMGNTVFVGARVTDDRICADQDGSGVPAAAAT